MWSFFGAEVVNAMLLSTAALPAVLVGLSLGLWLSRKIPDQALRRLCVAVLIVIAVTSIISPYVSR